jgi:hypothetical protein
LPTNFHKHQKTHGMTIKEYKLWLTQLLLDRDRAQSAGGGGGAGFGGARDDIGDDFGGGFGGGFGDEDDRGAQDDRFVDVPDEPAEAKVTLAVALKDKGTRNKLREVDDLWLSNVRARIAPSERTKTTYFGQAVSVLELLSAPGRELVARVTLLEPNSSAAHVKRFAN